MTKGQWVWTTSSQCPEQYLAYSRSTINILIKIKMFGNRMLFKMIFPSVTFCFYFVLYFPVENDPHFIIYLPKSQKNICFNIDSEPGKILNLVSDPESGEIKRYCIRIRQLDHCHASLSLPGISFFPP